MSGVLEKLRTDVSGQFAIFFAICAMVLVAGIGIAVDNSQFSTQQERAQSVLDIAALAIADNYLTNNPSVTDKELKAFINNNFDKEMGSSLKAITHKINGSGHLQVSSNLKVDPFFGRIFGVDKYQTNVESVVNLPNNPNVNEVNVAIGWDASTSMTSLLPNVKSAVLTLNTELVANDFDGELSIFPYSQYETNRNIATLMSERDLKLDSAYIENFITNVDIMTSGPAHTNGGAACGWETIAQANETIETVHSDDLNVIFFMHDGDGFCGADDKILEQCQIVRDRGIILIAVRFGFYSTKEQLFLDCVGGDTSKYFYVDSAETAIQAFLGGTFGEREEKYIVR